MQRKDGREGGRIRMERGEGRAGEPAAAEE